MEKIGLRFNAGVEYQGKLYASVVGINGLFQLDLGTEKIVYVKRFSEEGTCFALHRCCFLYGNEAWFIPQNGKYISVVNLETMEIEYINPPYRRTNKEAVSDINAVYYSGGMIEDRYLYLIPTNIDTLLLIDLKSRSLYPYYNVTRADEYYLYGGYENGCIYLFPYTGKEIVEINLRTDMRRRYEYKYEMQMYGYALKHNGKYWFCPYVSDHVLMLDINTMETEKILLGKVYDEECTYEEIITYENNLFLIPFESDKILTLNDEKMVSAIPLEDRWLENKKNGFISLYSQSNMILASYHKNTILIYEKEQNAFRSVALRIEFADILKEIEERDTEFWKRQDCLKEVFSEEFFPLGKWYEEQNLGVKYYIKVISPKKSRTAFSEEGQWTTGKRLWECLRSGK